MDSLKIVLTAVEGPLAPAWQRWCGDLRCVKVHQGSIFDAACDAVVIPANSFGFMDGGIDRLYSGFFGLARAAIPTFHRDQVQRCGTTPDSFKATRAPLP